jgi:hypothetical protein
MRRAPKIRKPQLGTIGIIESQRLDYLVGPDLARILSRRYVDLRVVDLGIGARRTPSFIQKLVTFFKEGFYPRVVSVSSHSALAPARTINVDRVIERMLRPEKAEVIRRVLIKTREMVESA